MNHEVSDSESRGESRGESPAEERPGEGSRSEEGRGGESASSESTQGRSWRASLAHELRTHPFGYIVLGLFVVAGPILAPFVFPQAPPAVAIVGGLAFGAYAALCAVPQKFL